MRGLYQQLFLRILGSLIVLSVCLIIVIGVFINNQAISDLTIDAQRDLSTVIVVIDQRYPGTWKLENGIM